MKKRTFTSSDQSAFAELSGDYNPIHMDAIAARRLIFGYPVVHGIHALLWSLDCLLEDMDEPVNLHAISASFPKPIIVDEEVILASRRDDDGRRIIQLLNGEIVTATVKVQLGAAGDNAVDIPHDGFPEKRQPCDVPLSGLESASGELRLYLHRVAAKSMFPNLMRCLSPLQISVLLASTRLVGSVCPGLHSIYSELSLSENGREATAALHYEVVKYDRRFGLATMDILAPGLSGTIKAFYRPEPVGQASYRVLQEFVSGNEFAGQRALVVGGSRGLGEVAAKLLCAGGADTKITYHMGRDDAVRVVDDIASNGGIADCFQLDVLGSGMGPPYVESGVWVPTHMYYFASPFIFSGVKGVFSEKLFRKFCDYYVTGLVNFVGQAIDYGVSGIFYPSTVAIDELPVNMAEYTAAKAASEIICRIFGKTNPEMLIYQSRFPRMATDQTVSMMPVTNQDPAPILLGELRAFRDSLLSRKDPGE